VPIYFTPGTGAFDQLLDLGGVNVGDHVLTVTAMDQAGNSTTAQIGFNLPELVPLIITSTLPSNGALDVGATYKPKINFSRPVDPSTLNSGNFYATFGGQKLAATIVPANDGSFAWLFFDEVMPGNSQVRVTVDGSTILGTDGAALDADGNSTPGGVRTFDFFTVSLSDTPNTSLSGIIVDPGPDLQPHTIACSTPRTTSSCCRSRA
jgi:hypothetical protein